MVTRRYNFSIYEIEGLRKEINNDPKDLEDLFRSFVILSKINASAFKGYGSLDDFQEKVNRLVYSIKEENLLPLFRRAFELGGDTGFRSGVLYYRHTNGIQISYHTTSDYSGEKFSNSNPTWDGVKYSWEYDPEEYKAAVKAVKESFEKAKEIFEEYIWLLQRNVKNYSQQKEVKTLLFEDFIEENFYVRLSDVIELPETTSFRNYMKLRRDIFGDAGFDSEVSFNHSLKVSIERVKINA